MTSLATTKRETVTTAIRTSIEALDGGWAAYPSPADIVSLPCVVLGPGEPYRQRLTLGDFGTSRERLRLVAHVFVNRAVGHEALDMFDDAADAVLEALDSVSYSTDWTAVRPVGEVEVNGHEALGASIDIEVL